MTSQRLPTCFAALPAAVVLATILLGTILLGSQPVLGQNSIDGVRVSSTLDPNSVLITEVDVIFIFDEAVFNNAGVQGFPGTKTEWYSRKFMMRRNAGDGVKIVTTSVPQGFDYVDIILPENHRQALRVLAFAQHQDGNEAALDLTGMVRPLLEIDNFGLLLSERD